MMRLTIFVLRVYEIPDAARKVTLKVDRDVAILALENLRSVMKLACRVSR